MKKQFLLLMLSIAAFAVDAQRLLETDIAKITQKMTLSGVSVTSISTDTTLASPTNNQLVTAKTVRDYAWKLGGRPVASTAPSSGEVLKWDGTKWAPGAAGGGATGTDGEVAVFSTGNNLVSYPELAFDGSQLNLNADLNTLKASPTWSLIDNSASSSGSGGTLSIGNFDGTALAGGHRFGALQFMGSTGVGGTAIGGLIESFAFTTWSGTNAASRLSFSVPNIGTHTQTERLRVSPGGVEARSGSAINIWNTANSAKHSIYSYQDSIFAFDAMQFSDGGEFSFNGEITSSSLQADLTSNVNNFYVGTNLFVSLTAETTNRNMTGIQHRSALGSTRYLILHNDGGNGSHLNNVVLKNQDSGSSSTNQFALPGGADFTLEPYESVFLAHVPNSGLDRWVVLGSSKNGTGGGGGGGHVVKDDATAMTQRDTLNFVSSSAIDVAATDVATGAGRTEVRFGIKTGAVGSAELENLGSAGSCTNCSVTVDADGRVSTYSSGGAQINEFTTAQTATSLSVPAGAKTVEIICVGSGSGGGSGRKGAAGTVRCGGGGGAAGNVSILSFSVAALGSPSTLSVTVGAGGAGGAAQTTNDANGNNGGAGNASEVKVGSATIVYAAGAGTAGAGGTATNGTAGAAASPGMFQGGSGGAANTSGSAGSSGAGVTNCVGNGGGAGGGINTSNTASNGGSVGFAYFSTITGPTGGTGGGNGSDGNTVTGIHAGSGGSGGASSTTGNAGNGGNGARGAGGGGGGAAVNSTGNSGAGGAGGAGYVRVTFYF